MLATPPLSLCYPCHKPREAEGAGGSSSPGRPRLRLKERLRGGGSKEQEDYKEEEVVKFVTTQRIREYKYLQDDQSKARQTPFWICPECGNMLYPKEDRASMSLHRLCRNCGHEDAADNNLVYVNDLRPQAQTADAGAEMSKDPTLPHAKGIECAGPDPDKPDGKCGHDEAVFFQAPLKGDSAMKLIFMCCKCAYRWVQ